MLRFTISLLLVALIMASCSRHKTPVDLKDYLILHKQSLDLLVKNLQADKHLDSLFHIAPDSGLPGIKKSHPQIYGLLERCGITAASSHKNANYRNVHWYYFKTNWPDEYPIYLIYNSSDEEETVKGFYKKDDYQNETWGLGENWKMFRFVKTITNIKL